MTKNLLVIDITEDYFRYQELYDLDTEKCIFSVSDLYECPEDATVDRDLTSADEIVDFIKLGMKYMQEGYTKLNVFWKELREEPESIKYYINKYKK